MSGSSSQKKRKIQHICAQEIASAAKLCLEDACSLAQDDLIKATGNLLGYARISEDIRDRISDVVAGMLTRKEILAWEGMVYLADLQ
jgi:hypothetical protein